MLQTFALLDLSSHVYGPNGIFVFISSGGAGLAGEEPVANDLHHAVNPLPFETCLVSNDAPTMQLGACLKLPQHH